jgi:prepilin-type N-terminal cleavage/methylation domain-containing protein
MTQLTHRSHGFTLIELAIVLFIVSLLIGGMLMPLSAQHEVRGRQETEKALANIREALIGFAIINGRLPCPAARTIASGATSAGLEVTTGAGAALTCACTTAGGTVAGAGNVCNETTPGYVTGVLPWATLGIPETDAWNNRYTYSMIALFGRAATGQTTFGTDDGNSACTAATPASAAFALCSARTSANPIKVLPVAGSVTSIVSSTPAIVVSHGKNMLGAFPTTGGTQITGAAGDEAENANGDATFVSSGSIDDQLIWIPASILMSRMLAAGKLP